MAVGSPPAGKAAVAAAAAVAVAPALAVEESQAVNRSNATQAAMNEAMGFGSTMNKLSNDQPQAGKAVLEGVHGSPGKDAHCLGNRLIRL